MTTDEHAMSRLVNRSVISLTTNQLRDALEYLGHEITIIDNNVFPSAYVVMVHYESETDSASTDGFGKVHRVFKSQVNAIKFISNRRQEYENDDSFGVEKLGPTCFKWWNKVGGLLGIHVNTMWLIETRLDS